MQRRLHASRLARSGPDVLKGCGCKHLTEERHARANMGRCLCSTLIHTVGWQCGFPGQLTHPVRALPKWGAHIRLSRAVRRSPHMPMSNLWKGARVEERRCNTRGSCRPLSDGRVPGMWHGLCGAGVVRTPSLIQLAQSGAWNRWTLCRAKKRSRRMRRVPSSDAKRVLKVPAAWQFLSVAPSVDNRLATCSRSLLVVLTSC